MNQPTTHTLIAPSLNTQTDFGAISPLLSAGFSRFNIHRRCPTDKARVEHVLAASRMNLSLAAENGRQVAPFAAAIFDKQGLCISIGVDSPGERGHEVNNALIGAQNVLEDQGRAWPYTLVTLTPPCRRCFGQIKQRRPDIVVSILQHADLVAFFPEIPRELLAPPTWQAELHPLGIVGLHSRYRFKGVEFMREVVKES